jgi:ubiquinol-cytochrome c reductase cytochrome b subunit
VRRPRGALAAWLDDRAGLQILRRHLLDEPLPAGTGWWFTLGSVVLFGLSVQIATGIALALYYAPTPDHAWDSVQYITTSVRGGRLLRGLHHWGASIIVVAAIAHLTRVVFQASYRKPRELNWILGLLLLQIILAFGLTGYLLPWDQRAYWATVVTINIAKLAPVVGEGLAALLRGGPDIGALTLTRWYAVHVLVLPVALAALVVAHLYLMRRHGISGPVRPRPGPSLPFYPFQAARDLTVSAVIGIGWVALAWMGAPALEPPADPAASDYVPRPEWYFLGLFQLLRFFPGRLEVIGAIVVPGVAFTLLALLPWLDRGTSRTWRSRRFVLAAFTAAAAGVIALTVFGALDRPASSAGSWNIREQAGSALIGEADRCGTCHGPGRVAPVVETGRITRPSDWLAMHVADPIALAPGLRPAPEGNAHDRAAIVAALARMRAEPPPALDPAVARIAVLFNRHCLRCHRMGSVGGDEGPDLTRVGSTLEVTLIEQRIVNPLAVDPTAEMPAFADKLTLDEIRALAVWLGSRR